MLMQWTERVPPQIVPDPHAPSGFYRACPQHKLELLDQPGKTPMSILLWCPGTADSEAHVIRPYSQERPWWWVMQRERPQCSQCHSSFHSSGHALMMWGHSAAAKVRADRVEEEELLGGLLAELFKVSLRRDERPSSLYMSQLGRAARVSPLLVGEDHHEQVREPPRRPEHFDGDEDVSADAASEENVAHFPE
jgi:hypothetical protein